MARIKSRSTSIENLLWKAVREAGLKYRRNVKVLPGKPDIAFPGKKVVVFCDSEFWHGRYYPDCVKRIKTNKAFWRRKIVRNMRRDKEVNAKLRKSGWKVMRFWDDEIRKETKKVVQKILKTLR